MVKNHKLAKSISDVSWGKFFDMIEYKAKWYGKEFVKIDRFASSSKTCSNCGWIKKDLTLKDRVFKCNICGHTQDMDLNASLNIKALGVKSAIRTQSEMSASCVEAFKVERNIFP